MKPVFKRKYTVTKLVTPRTKASQLPCSVSGEGPATRKRIVDASQTERAGAATLNGTFVQLKEEENPTFMDIAIASRTTKTVPTERPKIKVPAKTNVSDMETTFAEGRRAVRRALTSVSIASHHHRLLDGSVTIAWTLSRKTTRPAPSMTRMYMRVVARSGEGILAAIGGGDVRKP
jgi:hypothetical protein